MAGIWILNRPSPDSGVPKLAHASFDGATASGPDWTGLTDLDVAAPGVSMAVDPLNHYVAVGAGVDGWTVYPIEGGGLGAALVPDQVSFNIGGLQHQISSVAWHPSGFYVAVCNSAGGLAVYRVAGPVLQRSALHQTLQGSNSLAWSPNGRYLAMASQGVGGALLLRILEFNEGNGSFVASATLNAPEQALSPLPVAWHPSSEFLALAYRRASPNQSAIRIYAWNGSALTQSGPVRVSSSGQNINALDWHPSGNALLQTASGGAFQPIAVWGWNGAVLSGPREPSADGYGDLMTAPVAATAQNHAAAWDAGGGWAAVALYDGISNEHRLYLLGYDAANGKWNARLTADVLPAEWRNSARTSIVRWEVGVPATPPTPGIVLSGSALTATEAEVRAGGLTLTYTISNATWSPTLGQPFDFRADNPVSSLFLDGLTGPTWTGVLRPLMDYTNINRESSTVVTITFPPAPFYDIATDETVSVNVTGLAVAGGGPDRTPSPPSFIVTAVAAPPGAPPDPQFPPSDVQNTRPTLQVKDARTNSVWEDVPGLLTVKVKRDGLSSPSVLEVTVAADEDADSAPLKRFYPMQEIRLVDHDHNLKPFSGRIDEAVLVEDPSARNWRIAGRDFLAVLADNYVQEGEWRSAALPIRGIAQPTDAKWVPSYIGDYAGRGTAGESRSLIVLDLMLNIVTGANESLVPSGTFAPNSLPIEARFDGAQAICILDAIRDLARADPWCVTCGSSLVDGKILAALDFPAGSGFGGELQTTYRHVPDNPRSVRYFPRGFAGSGLRFVYGPPDAATTSPLIGYNFEKQGLDLFSRVRPSGRGEGRDELGVIVPEMESTWDPERGLFRARRELPMHTTWAVGDATRAGMTSERDAIRARSLRDGAYSDLLSGHAGLSNYRGGPNRGTVTIPGLPYSPAIDEMLGPGYTVSVSIPQLAINDKFVAQSWLWRWPEDETTIVVARPAVADLVQQLTEGVRMQQDAVAAITDFADSYWQHANGQPGFTFAHSLGVRPGRVMVAAAVDSGEVDQRGHPIPVLGSEVDVPALHYAGAQGQNVGYSLTLTTHETLVIAFAHWIAYSEGAGWISVTGAGTLIRVRAMP